jgi:hypothetical protein
MTKTISRVQEKITFANESMSKVMKQFRTLQVSSAEESEFYKQFKAMPEKLGANSGK